MDISVDDFNYKGVDDLLEKVNNQLAKIISFDPILKDFPRDPLNEELEDALDIEFVRSWKIFITRDDGYMYEININKNATLGDLKQAFKRTFELHQKRGTCPFIPDKVRINWKYIWKRYQLSLKCVLLDDDSKKLKDYGVDYGAELSFLEIYRKKRLFINV